ncbi:DUF2066 domain-containing protein [Oceanibacterium hippocampi]|uniref:DUF2066 domain-containing protein n=1 Tax=Oceanibacterium hippocampi TaxID=745714 RepID=A0A1Y5SWM7_9PROT|nr:DUF2066 domain-containing protein [Oceanibacterium hippocampi]SLN48616.1 hypothetical protein OCH7691_02108 [Oceanibacterium hippocampi]
MLLTIRRIARDHAMVAVVSLLACLAAGDALARDIFSVEGIAVDRSAASAAEARVQALRDGQREALGLLLRRLTLKADHGRLPSLSDTDLTTVVKSIGIDNEKTSPTRYLASLSVSFKPNEIRSLLRNAGIPFSETLSKPMLVLPVYRTAGGPVLWDSGSEWFNAWAAIERPDSVIPVILPLGDIDDIATISADAALAGNQEAIDRMVARYNVAELLVAEAAIVDTTVDGNGTVNGGQLALALYRYGAGGPQSRVENFALSGTTAEILAQGARLSVESLEDAWKADNLLRFGEEGVLSALVPLTDLSGWLTVRDRLERAAAVRRIDLAALTVTDAQVVLHYLGSPEQLAVALAQLDLSLAEEGGYWTLRVASSTR